MEEKLVEVQLEGAAATARVAADVASLAGEVGGLGGRVEELSRRRRRRAQGAAPEPEPEPDIGENVKIIKPQTVYCGGPGGTTNDGTFDYSQCADRAFAKCHATACAGHSGHRRVQDAGTCDDLPSRSVEVTTECCDEAGEDCSGGYPHTCNAACAAIFLPFWSECRSALGRQFEPVVALCEAAGAAAPSLVEQLSVECMDGSAAADCVPDCSEAYHGFLMLLNIEGDDSKLSCELHHGLYSWVGSSVRSAHLLYVNVARFFGTKHGFFADGRRVPGLGLRDLLLRGGNWRRRGLHRDAG
jgi:hypothetical protein